MNIAEVLKARRCELNISQIDLAEMSMVSVATIKDIERGKGNPSLSTIVKILNVLGMEIQYHIRKTV